MFFVNIDYIPIDVDERRLIDVESWSNRGVVLAAAIFSFIHSGVVFFYTNKY